MQQTEQKRGEELAKIAAASFALVPSLSVSFARFALPYHHHLKEEYEDKAGRMADRRGAAMVLFLPVFPFLLAFVLSLYIIRYNIIKISN